MAAYALPYVLFDAHAHLNSLFEGVSMYVNRTMLYVRRKAG